MVYTLIVHMRAKPETVEEVKGKLHEASRIYRNDKETIDWHVMQDPKVSRVRVYMLCTKYFPRMQPSSPSLNATSRNLAVGESMVLRVTLTD